jgi:hypothetical protein
LRVIEDVGSVIFRGFGNCLYQLTQLNISEDLYFWQHRWNEISDLKKRRLY